MSPRLLPAVAAAAALLALSARMPAQGAARPPANPLPAQAWSCSAVAKEPFLGQAESFVLAALALSPVEATQAGYHEHQGRSLDTELGSNSPAALALQHALLQAGRTCFTAERAGSLAPEDRADLQLLRSNIEEELFSMDELHPERYRPEQPVEQIGSGLFFPLTQQYGTEAERLAGVVARMEQIPRYLKEAKENMREADPVFLETAKSEGEGDKEVIAQIGSSIPANSPLHARYVAAASAAEGALDGYLAFLANDLAKRPHTVTWRSGAEKYERIFAFSIGGGTTETPATLLGAAERDLEAVRAEMYAVATPLYTRWFRGEPAPEALPAATRANTVIAKVIDHINDDHTTPANLLPQVRSQVAAIEQFIDSRHLVTRSTRGNLRGVETPPFLREAFSVAGFHAPPALEPGGEGQYWVTPIDPTAPGAESKLREYNNWMLQYLTMHEALPGHYTQFEHANSIQPPARRILRALLGNGPYVEGWGEYGVREMEEAGYADHDPRFVLMVLKIRLRVIANAILDIRMQSMGMTDDEALALLQGQAFQTHSEAEGKLRRAKLTAGQLVTYYVGFHQWIAFGERARQAAGAGFNLERFNDAALDEGPLPIPVLEPLVLARLKGGATPTPMTK